MGAVHDRLALQDLANLVNRDRGAAAALAPEQQRHGAQGRGHEGQGAEQPASRGQGEIVGADAGVEGRQGGIENASGGKTSFCK